MTIVESHRIYIGAAGWLHPDWHEQLYPEDLPQDWQLAYYGNEFPLVMIRDQEWQQAGAVTDWLEETDNSPLFIAELPLQDANDELVMAAEPYLEKISQLGKRCLGIVCHVNDRISPDELEELLEKCNALAPTCVEAEGACSDNWQEILRRHSANLVWTSLDEIAEVNGPLVIAKINSAGVGLKALRGVMDNLLQYDDAQHTLVLIMDGENPDPEMIRQARVMLELM